MLVNFHGFSDLTGMKTWLVCQNGHVFKIDGMTLFVKMFKEGGFFVILAVSFEHKNFTVLVVIFGDLEFMVVRLQLLPIVKCF